jgi:hypothetical protein
MGEYGKDGREAIGLETYRDAVGSTVPRRLALYDDEDCCCAVAVAEVVEGGRGPSDDA